MRTTLVVAAAGLGVFVLVAALAWWLQRDLIYFPFGEDVPPAATALPGAIDVRIETEDGMVLGGWYLPHEAGPAVVVFPGNAGNRLYRAQLAHELERRGIAVLLFDYRGYGGNPGQPSEEGLVRDGRAAVDWLARRPEIDPARIAYFGESLGAAVAVAVATERPPSALVLRSPFTSLADVGRLHYPFLPVRWLLADRYPVLEGVRRLDCPVLVIAGDRDGIVPADLSRDVYDAVPGSDKRWLLVAGANHNDAELVHGAELVTETAAFVSRHSVP
jgi:fermentation-respiration switch protein FrsA (DUF1100 family)